jgi:hypothetical protein
VGALQYLILSQASGTTPDLAAWSAQGQRFFGSRLDRGRDDDHVVLRGAGADAQRHLVARDRTPADLQLADAAEARAGGGGLALLARRCPTVWCLARDGADDAAALRIAAILASVLLGPVLDPSVPELFGVKTARERLERLDAPAASLRRPDR